jgi:uncharacterized membrane protein
MPIRQTLKARWLWYSILSLFLSGPYAIVSKLGSKEIPAPGMQLLFVLGSLPVAAGLLGVRRFRLEKNWKGIGYGIAAGLVGALGTLGLFAAYRTGGNTAAITASTGLYPMVTVLLAVLLLRERLTALQIVGLGFAGTAIVIFSL